LGDPRAYPDRPHLAASAAIFRDGKVLLVRRARKPALDIWTLPGGGVEAGETLHEALRREVVEETGLAIDIIAPAGHREMIARDADDRVSRHFVIMAFAARWRDGEPVLNEELSDFRWVPPDEVAGFQTTEGLAEIVAAAFKAITSA
jgi:8-oxo-dGTP diphosphatase